MWAQLLCVSSSLDCRFLLFGSSTHSIGFACLNKGKGRASWPARWPAHTRIGGASRGARRSGGGSNTKQLHCNDDDGNRSVLLPSINQLAD